MTKQPFAVLVLIVVSSAPAYAQKASARVRTMSQEAKQFSGAAQRTYENILSFGTDVTSRLLTNRKWLSVAGVPVLPLGKNMEPPITHRW
jgi:hypothetical protein